MCCVLCADTRHVQLCYHILVQLQSGHVCQYFQVITCQGTHFSLQSMMCCIMLLVSCLRRAWKRALPFQSKYSSATVSANLVFVSQPSPGSQRKKALGFGNIQSPWCSSFGICITMYLTSFPCGWVQSSCVRWQQQCFPSTSDHTLRW